MAQTSCSKLARPLVDVGPVIRGVPKSRYATPSLHARVESSRRRGPLSAVVAWAPGRYGVSAQDAQLVFVGTVEAAPATPRGPASVRVVTLLRAPRVLSRLQGQTVRLTTEHDAPEV